MNLDIWKKSVKKVEEQMALKYFKLSEFDDAPGTGKNMKKEFLTKLDKARAIADVPFKITSGYRSKETNKRVGGVSTSSHLKGLAADISCKDSSTRQKIISGLIKAGFTRIGIADTFIHCDTDKDKQDAIWLY
jgi:zinc D-Ala-D-Ala carboxypeptidase